MNLVKIDEVFVNFCRQIFLPMARFAIFIVYFWFGVLKIFNLSPASPLASALIANTVGIQHFNSLFLILGIFECILGILFLFPKFLRLAMILLFGHMVIVCSPLILVANLAWQKPFVPTLEGQYIIKNIVIMALTVGIAANTNQIKAKH